jgi:hypothetical protein
LDYYQTIFNSNSEVLIFSFLELENLGKLLDNVIPPQKRAKDDSLIQIQEISIKYSIRICLLVIIVDYDVINSMGRIQ